MIIGVKLDSKVRVEFVLTPEGPLRIEPLLNIFTYMLKNIWPVQEFL